MIPMEDGMVFDLLFKNCLRKNLHYYQLEIRPTPLLGREIEFLVALDIVF
jgi:hypothetical protein